MPAAFRISQTAPASARDQARQRGQPDPVGWLVPDPRGLTAQHCILMPERQHLRVLGHASAQHDGGRHDQVPGQRGDDRQHQRSIVPDAVRALTEKLAGHAQNRDSERDRTRYASSREVLLPSQPTRPSASPSEARLP